MADKNIDAELAAVKAILSAVEPLDPPLRMKVIQAASALLPPPTPPQPPNPPTHGGMPPQTRGGSQ